MKTWQFWFVNGVKKFIIIRIYGLNSHYFFMKYIQVTTNEC